MNKTLKSIASGAAAFSITAGSAFAQNNTQNIDRMDLDGELNSATICSQDTGTAQTFFPVHSIRECFDIVKSKTTFDAHFTDYRGYEHHPFQGAAYANDTKVAEFTCTGGAPIEKPWYDFFSYTQFEPTICTMD